MIESRESYQPLLQSNTPPSPSRRKQQRRTSAPPSSYGTLMGESLLHADNDADGAASNKPIINNGYQNQNNNGPSSSTPQSFEQPSRGKFEYTQPLNNHPIPVQQAAQQQQYHQQQYYSNNNAIPPPQPINVNGLPPAIPMRRRVDSSGDRSIGELSTVSGASGHNRLQRASSSDGGDVLHAPNANANNGYPAPKRRTSRRSGSPKPPRSRSPTPNSMNANANSNAPPGHPLHRRRPSDGDRSASSRHRRTHSFDVPPALKRQGSSNSLYSMNSQGSMTSESVKLLPDPRWGGGSGGGRGRSFSGGSREMVQRSQSQESQYGYGSVNSGKGVITARADATPRRGHRRGDSEISAASYASAASVDGSVVPVVTDLSKSAMLKGVTDEGVVRMQLPKDNFRLLSDRDLESGCVYKRALVPNESDYFQDYHITLDPTLESPRSVALQGTKQLPPTYYVMAVDSDIYRRMFDEVAESVNMPCKLFYCGHHEDVDYPSIGIAVVGVVIIFAVMFWAAFVVDA